MPPKRTKVTRSKAGGSLKQSNLFAHFSSSPPPTPAPRRNPKPTPKDIELYKPKPSQRRGKPLETEKEAEPSYDGDDAGSELFADIRFEPVAVEVSDSDHGAPRPSQTPAKKRKRRINSTSPSRSASPVEVETDLDDGPKPARRTVSRRAKSKIIIGSDDEDQSPRRVTKGVRPPTPDGDMDDLDEDKILDTRLRERGKKTLFQVHLERMRQKRLSNDQIGGFNIDSEEDDTPFKGAKPYAGSNEGDITSEEEESESSIEIEEDDFIVNDGEKSLIQLPAAFSMRSHQDTAHQFKIVCQFLVHVAIRLGKERRRFVVETMQNPDPESGSPADYFQSALKVARRNLSGLKDSMVTSSVWPPYFKNSLEKYPDFEQVALEFKLPHCDACRLGGRQSSILGRVGGNRYDKNYYEEIEDSDSSGDEGQSDSDDSTKTSNKKEFHLGRFCARRAMVFHALSHWEYHLFKALKQEVDDLNKIKQGKRSDVRIGTRVNMNLPSLGHGDDASEISDWLEDRGIIEMEWEKFKEVTESARNLEISAKRGENREYN